MIKNDTMPGAPDFSDVEDFHEMIGEIGDSPYLKRQPEIARRMLSGLRAAIEKVRECMWEVLITGDLPPSVTRNVTNLFGFRDALGRVLVDLVLSSRIKWTGLSETPPRSRMDDRTLAYLEGLEESALRHEQLLVIIAATARRLRLDAHHLFIVRRRRDGFYLISDLPDDPEELAFETWRQCDAEDSCAA